MLIKALFCLCFGLMKVKYHMNFQPLGLHYVMLVIIFHLKLRILDKGSILFVLILNHLF